MSRVARATHPRAVLRRRTSTQDHQHAHHVLRLCHLRGRARRAHRAPRQQARRERRSDARGSRERRRRRRPERCVSSPLSGTRTRRHRGARAGRRVSRSTRARGANARAAARGASQPRVRARSRGKKSISSHSASHVELGQRKHSANPLPVLPPVDYRTASIEQTEITVNVESQDSAYKTFKKRNFTQRKKQ